MNPSTWNIGCRPGSRHVDEFSEGDTIKGTVKAVNDFGVFLDIGTSKDALLPWAQVDGSGPGAGEVLSLVVARVDRERQRITLSAPAPHGGPAVQTTAPQAAGARSRSPSRSRAAAAHSGGAHMSTTPVGGFIHDVVQGVRVRRKGGKGDGRGAYAYADGMPFLDLMADDDVSGHVTNIEKEGCWVDIGALKDGFLRWENAPRHASRWQVGDMLDDLKIVSCSGTEITLKWDDDGIGSLTEKDWERLFAQGPPVPPPQDLAQGPPTGENCCAMYGSAGPVRSGGAGEQERGLVGYRPTGQAASDLQAVDGRDAAKGKGKGQAHGGKARGKGVKGGTIEDFGKTGRGKGKDKDGFGWGKGEGPAYDGVGDYGSCKAAPELRGKSAPPPALKRPRPLADLAVGEVVRGRVTNLSRTGVLVDFGCEVEGLIPRALVTLQCRKGEVIPKLNIMGIDASLGKVTLEPLEDDDSAQA